MIKEIIQWFIDQCLCWRYGHITKTVNGKDLYCIRCGHFEVIKVQQETE